MARIKPFRGIRYNPESIASLSDVVSPPYDVISSEKQTQLHYRSPYNVVRMELGLPRPGDDRQDNPHVRAGQYLKSWFENGVLIQEPVPAVYLTAVEFDAAGAPATRWGLLAAVSLEPFGKGSIRPHERTYSKVKSERLSLMRACRANLSPIFSFFPDQRGTLAALIRWAAPKAPVYDFKDDDGHRHRLWVIREPDLHRKVVADLEGQPLFIADGHHRYETALAYRDELARATGGLPPNHPANDVLMYLSSIQDPGLVILPAHRLLPEVAPVLRRTFLERAGAFFEVQPIDIPEDSRDKSQPLLEALNQTPQGGGLVVVVKDAEKPVLLKLKTELAASIYPPEVPDEMKNLDVTLLTEFIFPEFLGLSGTHLDEVDRVHYHHDARTTLEEVSSGRYAMAFIIKPTPITTVRQIADAGLVMPRKSTYFAPKVITGLVIHNLETVN